MGLVPLGISMNSWTRSIDPKSQNRATYKTGGSFMDESGSHTFHRVTTPSHESNKKGNLSSKVTPKVVSPLTQILEQTKEREKMSDAPEVTDISLDFAAASSTSSKKKKSHTPTKTTKKKKTKDSKARAMSAIKRLKKKRNSQSSAKRGAVKKPSIRRKGPVKKKKKE